MNHYTVETIRKLGSTVGEVIVISFDPKESLKTDFVCVKLNFNTPTQRIKQRI